MIEIMKVLEREREKRTTGRRSTGGFSNEGRRGRNRKEEKMGERRDPDRNIKLPD